MLLGKGGGERWRQCAWAAFVAGIEGNLWVAPVGDGSSLLMGVGRGMRLQLQAAHALLLARSRECSIVVGA